jgi:hypothetical protein
MLGRTAIVWRSSEALAARFAPKKKGMR